MTTETTGNDSTSCCSRIKSWGCLGWYLGPITYDFGLALCTIFYFFIMVFITLGLSIYTGVSYVVCIALFAPFCVGVPLVYLNAEILIGVARFIILAPVYYLLETDKINAEKKVYLAVQNGMPLCGTWCQNGNQLSRPKYIFTSSQFYKMTFYNLIISPVCTWVLASTVFLVVPPLYFMHHVFRYPFNTSWYKNKHECLGSNNNKHCHGWLINNFGDCFACFLIGLVVLPLTLKLVINCGQLSKKICYYFLTYYYNPNIPRIRMDVGETNNGNINSKGSVQLNESYNVQFIGSNHNYHSVDDNDLVSV